MKPPCVTSHPREAAYSRKRRRTASISSRECASMMRIASPMTSSLPAARALRLGQLEHVAVQRDTCVDPTFGAEASDAFGDLFWLAAHDPRAAMREDRARHAL